MDDVIPGYFTLSKLKERQFLLLIIVFNFIIKAIPAGILELGNDEVYYWTYALFPDWSHFDHPPMVGLTIQLFTLNLYFHNEIFMRLGSLVLSSLNIVILYYLVKKIYSQNAAFISVLLFTASIYFNIISGLFILPDTPQTFFMLLSLYFGIPAVIANNPSKNDSNNLILFGLFVGLAFLSKYHSLFIWFGFGLYILFNNRVWFKKPSLYISLLITMILMIPVFYWNIKNNFMSFTYHGNRIGLFQSPPDILSFARFNLGQFGYQNPILFIIFILTLITLVRKKRGTVSRTNILLIYLSLPLILIFTLFSLFKNTLPHWSGPAFIGLLILSSEWLSELSSTKGRRVAATLVAANLLVVFVLIVGSIQVNHGIFIHSQASSDPAKLGKSDFTLDMYGWKQAKRKFNKFLLSEDIKDSDHERVKIISNKCYPASHLDFYIAHPLNIDLVALGNIEDIHKYYWINRTRKINPQDRVFFITSSQHYFAPEELNNYFSRIIPRDTISIDRNGIKVKNLFVYEMFNYKEDTSQSNKIILREVSGH